MVSLLDHLARSKVVAILRAERADAFGDVTDALVAEGIRAVEFTLTGEGVFEAIEAYARCLPANVLLGAGTVLSTNDARRAIDLGASFLVTPVVLPDVIEVGTERGVPVVAGALTPTEVHLAHSAGASLVKIFPAALGGPSYLRQLREPLPAARLVPTGGVGIDNATEYLAAGAFAVGLGGQLIGDALRGGSLAELRTRAERLRSLVDAAVAA